MSARTPKPTPMAFLTIGFSSFLMDASKAMKVAELMTTAVEAEWNYARGGLDTFTVKGPANVEFRVVRADQIRMPQGEPVPTRPAQQRLLK